MLNSVVEMMCQQMLQTLEGQKKQFASVIVTLNYIQRAAGNEVLRQRAQQEQFKIRQILTAIERAQAAAMDNDADGLLLWTTDMRIKVEGLDMDLLKVA